MRREPIASAIRSPASCQLTVSGDDDPQRLLLLVDRTNSRPATRPRHRSFGADRRPWPWSPATSIGSSSNGRSRSQTGANRLQIPVTAAMAPGFTLAVSVMADNVGWDQIASDSPAHHDRGNGGPCTPEASLSHPTRRACTRPLANLHVDADLQVKIECHRHGDATAAPRPGEPADVTVTTCDAQGKPVAAEVSLAMLARRSGEPTSWPVGRWRLLPQPRSRSAIPDGLQHPVPLSARQSCHWHGRTRGRRAGRAGTRSARRQQSFWKQSVCTGDIAAQQGIPVARPQAADDNPFGDADSSTAPAAAATPADRL